MPNEGARELLWAVSLQTAGGGEVVIALGEARDGSPAYEPDGLVVIFSPVTARSYLSGIGG